MRAFEIHMGGTGDGGFAPERIKCQPQLGRRAASLLSLQYYMHVRHPPGNPHLPCLPGHINEDSELRPAWVFAVANFLASWSLDLLCVSRDAFRWQTSHKMICDFIKPSQGFCPLCPVSEFRDRLFSFRQLHPAGSNSRLLCFYQPWDSTECLIS